MLDIRSAVSEIENPFNLLRVITSEKDLEKIKGEKLPPGVKSIVIGKPEEKPRTKPSEEKLEEEKGEKKTPTLQPALRQPKLQFALQIHQPPHYQTHYHAGQATFIGNCHGSN